MPDSTPSDDAISANRSTLREFLASLSTIRGDLSTITAPPFVLDTKSTVELPQYWAEHLDSFVAPAQSNDPGERMLRVLKWWLSSLRGQQYAGRDPNSGVKKPLNAVLGECFVGWWDSEDRDQGIGRTHLVSEQVSHHPPVTACRVWNDELGVEAEGFTRQEITFSMSSGSVNIAQMGYALFKLRKVPGGNGQGNDEGEVYLIPLPDVRVKGVLSGTPYPELGGSYHIPSTSGWGAEVEFSGKGFLGIGGGKSGKNGFEAKVFQHSEASSHGSGTPVWTISGNWDSSFTIKDKSGHVLEEVDVAAMPTADLQLVPEEKMDPYETRQVWKDVRKALNKGDMQGTSSAKNIVEQGQRDMRKQEEQEGKTWQRLFFSDVGEDVVAEKLRSSIGTKLDKEQTVGIWKFNSLAWDEKQRPWRGGLRPDNTSSSAQQPSSAKRESQVNGVAAVQPHGHDRTSDSAERRTSAATGMSSEAGAINGHTPATSADKVDSQLQGKDRRSEVQDDELANGVDDMSLREQTAVEEFIRAQYSSRSKRHSGHRKG
ncbi:Protein kes1 [Cyphellophora attinorum]|uniref:Protein kes1 n=1 Tax=Cyphellophora attinorum TaxID=1664694 RepID=A0A0N0NQW3_9EURO|nr:Protein kes1 [Phialophora attinorum]KPI44139.1 Protein kes1 [Phialophora attinorum]